MTKFSDKYRQLATARRIQREGVAGLRTLLEPYRGAVPKQRRGYRWP